MTTTAAGMALTLGLAAMLATAGATPSFAQMRAGGEIEAGYGSSYCAPPSGDNAQEQKAYCDGWRAVRKGW